MWTSFVIRAEHAFDGERFLPGGVQVLVENGRIAQLLPRSVPLSDGKPVLERPGATVLPGLIDTHVHTVAGGEPDALALDAHRSAAEREQIVRRSLLAQVRAGVTTVRDLGDNRFAALGRPVADDEPAVVGSGPPITPPGGHCAALGGEAQGPEQLAAAVDRLHGRGAGVVKILVSGGAMTAGSDLLHLQFDVEAVRNVVRRAHRHGLPVTAHAHSVPSVEVCLEAGVDGIEHCTCLTATGIRTPPEVIDRLAERQVIVCPTFGRLPDLPPSPQAARIAHRTGMTLQERFAQVGLLHAAGVRLLAGTDAGIHPAKPHGVLPHSIAELLKSGLPIDRALEAATGGASRACALADGAGFLRRGAVADLLVVDGDPRDDVACLTRVQDVVLRGRPVVSRSPGTTPGDGLTTEARPSRPVGRRGPS
jgi:imidazolonepropionase-like amidohydrolase